MIAGLAFQVFTLAIFGILSLEYFSRVWRHKAQLNPMTVSLRSSSKFRGFLVALVLTYTFIMIRCIYRVIELAGGWGSKLMEDETLFIVLEGVMVIAAAIIMTVFHPGFCFREGYFLNKQQSQTDSEQESKNVGSDVESR
jgi:RTA1 like protein